MNAYAIYRITKTIRITIFLMLAMLVYDFYPITAVIIILQHSQPRACGARFRKYAQAR